MTNDEVLALYAACISDSPAERESGYQALGRLLYEIAWRRVADQPQLHDLAADSMQESLLVVWQRLEVGQGPREPERFVGWCATIVINKLREALRRLDPKPAVRRSKRVGLSKLTSLDAPVGKSGVSLGGRLPDNSAELDEAQSYREIRTAIAEIASIDAISEQSRTVLLKGFVEGLDDAELAGLLETSRSNVHVIRSRDLVKLRKLEDYMQRLKDLYS